MNVWEINRPTLLLTIVVVADVVGAKHLGKKGSGHGGVRKGAAAVAHHHRRQRGLRRLRAHLRPARRSRQGAEGECILSLFFLFFSGSHSLESKKNSLPEVDIIYDVHLSPCYLRYSTRRLE